METLFFFLFLFGIIFTFLFSVQGFDQLRIEGLLCDVTLVAGDGDEAFPVHRAMMASSSDYFKAMFTGASTKTLSDQSICSSVGKPKYFN